MPGTNWLKLDNAGKLYPAIANARWSSAFRVSAELKEQVEPSVLQQAVDRVLPRFPSLKVRMRTGVFWYYLEEIQEPLTVQPDVGHPCMPFRFRQNHGFLLRVFYYRSRISAEFFHSLTDGNGGLVFVKTLATEYLRLQGRQVDFDQGALDPAEPPRLEETEDAFLSMKLPRIRVSRKEQKAYHFHGTAEIPHTLHTIAASIPCDALLVRARSLGITLTEYLASVMLYVGCRDQKSRQLKKLRPVRVSVPVNLRAFFPTESMRNFSTFVNPGVDPRLGDYTFGEIAQEVHAFMRYAVNPRLLSATIATNVADEKNIFIRLVPLAVKNLVIGGIFRRAGDQLVTATLSNLGVSRFPTGTEEWIRRFEFQLGSPPVPMCNCACVTSGKELRLVFSSNIRETVLPRGMLRFLVEQGVPVEVESNLEDT